jgi:cytidylate kinase
LKRSSWWSTFDAAIRRRSLDSAAAASSVAALAYRVVCISPTDGSGGEQVGPIVASGLGFKLVNEEIVRRAAQEAGVDAKVVADAERRKSLPARLLDALTDAGPAGASGFSGFTSMSEGPGPRGDALRGLIRTVICESAERGNVVILGHAASLALGERTDVLRVLISASPQTRARRMAEARHIDEAEAKKLIARGDTNRADYVKRFYGISEELPTHYDVVLNTDHIAIKDAAAIVLSAARTDRPNAV